MDISNLQEKTRSKLIYALPKPGKFPCSLPRLYRLIALFALAKLWNG